MKKLLLLLSIIYCLSLYGQVGINNSSPNVTLEVTAKKTDGTTSEGIIAPHLTGDALHQADLNNKYGVLQDGTIAYVTAVPSAANTTGQTISIDAKGYYYYDYTQNKWMKFRFSCDATSGGTVSTFNCASATVSGSLASGFPATITASIPYTGGDGGTYSAQTVASTGVTGLIATLPAGTLMNGDGSVTYTISGTPSASGTAVFPVSLGGKSCNLSISVTGALATGSGTLSGKTCFDVAISNDNTNGCGSLSGRLGQQADFTQPATNTQTYTFTPSGTVSNVRFVYVNTNGNAITAITGGNAGNNISTAVTATVTYANTLNTSATGLTSSNPITSDIYVVYNSSANNTGSDVQIKLTVNIKDCACCGAFIAPGVFKEFLCHNLGAVTSLDPHDLSQTNAWGLNGAYIQWGKRGPTGDSRVTWITAANDGPGGFAAAPTGSTLAQANSGAITGWSTVAASNGTWNIYSKTPLDPCPPGWKVPSRTEWQGVISNNTLTKTGTFVGSNTNYNTGMYIGPNASTKLLTLPAAGSRSTSGGIQVNRGTSASYWSSQEVDVSAAPASYFFQFGLINATTNTPTAVATSGRVGSYTIRCIAE
jgi:uncharacterized protein (TIGR02145 family)